MGTDIYTYPIVALKIMSSISHIKILKSRYIRLDEAGVEPKLT